MTDKTSPPKHVRDMTPEEMEEGMRKIRRGSTDGGQTLPKPKAFEPIDVRVATKEELAAHAKKHGLRIKFY